jgi:PDZ domain
VPFREGERVALRYYFSQLFLGDSVSVTLLRAGVVLTVTAPLCVPGYLCPIHFDGAPPSYMVVGGLVFTVLSEPYLREEIDGQKWSLPYLVSLAHFGKKAQSEQEVVLLTQVLANPASLGYEGMANLHLLRFNGQPVLSLQHLASMVDAALSSYSDSAESAAASAAAAYSGSAATAAGAAAAPAGTGAASAAALAAAAAAGGAELTVSSGVNGERTTSRAGQYLKFEFYPDRVVVLEASAVAAGTEEVCEENAIPAARSKNLLQPGAGAAAAPAAAA